MGITKNPFRCDIEGFPVLLLRKRFSAAESSVHMMGRVKSTNPSGDPNPVSHIFRIITLQIHDHDGKYSINIVVALMNFTPIRESIKERVDLSIKGWFR